MMDSIPDTINGWASERSSEIYTRDTIFDYINGAGEIYRQYKFREVKVYRFSREGEPAIVLEIFDMGSSEDAFGVFTHGRSGDSIGIGQDSEHRPGWLCFWKDRYFVCAYAEGTSEAAAGAILDLGKTVAAGIKDAGGRPTILGCLPKEGQEDRSLRFFHTQASLNYHYFLSDANILRLNETTDAVLAGYQMAEGTPLLLLVSYEDEGQAETAFRSFLDNYVPEASQTHIRENEDGSWTAAKMQKAMMAIVFEAPDEGSAKTLLESIIIEE